MKLAVAFFIGLFFFFPGQALAGGICDFKRSEIPAALKVEAEKIENLSPALDRNREWQKAPVMNRSLTQKMLRATWKAFGYRGKAVKKRVQANIKQIKLDSGFRPHLEGLFPGQVGIPESDTPGGLFAFSTTKDYLEWKDYPGWRGDISRFNPLSNIVAAVGAQVSSGQVFSGKGRIAVGTSDWICISNKL